MRKPRLLKRVASKYNLANLISNFVFTDHSLLGPESEVEPPLPTTEDNDDNGQQEELEAWL